MKKAGYKTIYYIHVKYKGKKVNFLYLQVLHTHEKATNDAYLVPLFSYL